MSRYLRLHVVLLPFHVVLYFILKGNEIQYNTQLTARAGVVFHVVQYNTTLRIVQFAQKECKNFVQIAQLTKGYFPCYNFYRGNKQNINF